MATHLPIELTDDQASGEERYIDTMYDKAVNTTAQTSSSNRCQSADCWKHTSVNAVQVAGGRPLRVAHIRP